MSKILTVKEDIVQIGTDDGRIREVRKEDVNFEAKVGDKVDIFENESSVVVTKVEEKREEANQTSGVNININNSNNNGSNNSGIYQDYSKKVVNKWIYVLLAFFLGGIGAHKFYSGRIGSGICYLLFCWTGIPVIIAFIEFIIALCSRPDLNGNILV